MLTSHFSQTCSPDCEVLELFIYRNTVMVLGNDSEKKKIVHCNSLKCQGLHVCLVIDFSYRGAKDGLCILPEK